MSRGASRRRQHRRWPLWAVLTLVALLSVDYAAYPRLARIGGRSFDKGANGTWLRYAWYFGEWDDAKLTRLAEQLRRGQMGFAYCHVRDITADGRLRFRYPERGRKLVEALHRRIPSLKVIAWIYAANETAHGPVNIADAEVRQRMTDEAVWLVKECGFDGIQWDYEICPNGDRNLLTLLRETRAVLPDGAILSVCAPMWYPWPLSEHGWAEPYFQEVAGRCDQIAVMCYDSGVFMPRWYVWLVRQQTVRVTRAAARGDPHCRVLFGIPTYEKGGRSHCAHAENLRMALKGVREGLADPRTKTSAFAGVAVFADYTTSSREWQTYRTLWVRHR